MNYLDAFNILIKQRGYESLDNIFMVRSFLSDLIGNSYIDLSLVDAFYLLNKNTLIHQTIRNKNLLDSKGIIKGIINQSDNKYSRAQYIQSVEPLLLYLFPNEYQLFSPKSPQKVGEIHKIRNKKPANVITPLIIKPAINQPIMTPPVKTETINIVIKAECLKLTVKNSDKNVLAIYDKNGVVITNAAKRKDANGELVIRFSDPNNEYTIELPKKKYRDIELMFKGLFLKVDGLESKHIEYSGYSDMTEFIITTNIFTGGQKTGVFSINGKVGSINFVSECAKVYGFIEPRNNGRFFVFNQYGVIDFTFDRTRIKPRVNRLLKAPTCAEGDYLIGKKHIRLSLRTLVGKVYVF